MITPQIISIAGMQGLSCLWADGAVSSEGSARSVRDGSMKRTNTLLNGSMIKDSTAWLHASQGVQV